MLKLPKNPFTLIRVDKLKKFDMSHETLKLEVTKLEETVKQLKRDNELLRQLLDIEQQNTRMNK